MREHLKSPKFSRFLPAEHLSDPSRPPPPTELLPICYGKFKNE